MKDGKATISDHVRNIWQYNDLIKKYGEEIATKLFTVFQYNADLNHITNPAFAKLNELEKLDTIIHSVCPNLPVSIDWDDIEIVEPIELTRILFETASYRTYLASKKLLDKITYELEYTHVDLSKESGNSGEIKKAYELQEMLRDKTKKVYEEFIEEQGAVRKRGKGVVTPTRNPGGKSKELD